MATTLWLRLLGPPLVSCKAVTPLTGIPPPHPTLGPLPPVTQKTGLPLPKHQ